MIIKSFKQYESIIEYDYINKKISNEITDFNETQYKQQGWFLYHKNILDVHAKKPPKNGEYDVRTENRMDVAKFKNGKFNNSEIYGLKDGEIKYWKIRQSDDSELKYKYNDDTGKWEKGKKIIKHEIVKKSYSEMDKSELNYYYRKSIGENDIDELKKIIKYL